MTDPISNSLIHIVDDDDAVRHALGFLIRSQGGRVCLYASAGDFLTAGAPPRQSQAATCLLLDLQLNGKSGADLLEDLQQQGRMLPAIIITAHVDSPLMQRAMRAGAQTFVKKPFRNGELLRAISEALLADETQA